MVYDVYLYPWNMVVDSDDNVIWHLWIDCDIMPSTWLVDKNWKEIYKWDILQSTRPAAMKYKVIRDDELAWFLFEDEFEDCFHPNKVWELIIIWNIYENPELINA